MTRTPRNTAADIIIRELSLRPRTLAYLSEKTGKTKSRVEQLVRLDRARGWIRPRPVRVSTGGGKALVFELVPSIKPASDYEAVKSVVCDSILGFLAAHEPQTVSNLARSCGVSSSWAANNLYLLEAAGKVQRVESSNLNVLSWERTPDE